MVSPSHSVGALLKTLVVKTRSGERKSGIFTGCFDNNVSQNIHRLFDCKGNDATKHTLIKVTLHYTINVLILLFSIWFCERGRLLINLIYVVGPVFVDKHAIVLVV